MNLKTLFLGITAIAFATNSMAQDRIYKKNGDVVEGKVKSVDTRSITFKRADNAKGPDYTVNKNEIEKVEYENGTEDVFGDRKRSFHDDDEDNEGREIRGHGHKDHMTKGKGKPKYGANLVAFSPASVTENGFGIGLSYEHNFGKKGFLSFYMPLALSFGNVYDNIYPGSTNGNFNNGYTNLSLVAAVKFYPTGAKGKVRYSIAPALALVTGQRPVSYPVYDPYGYVTYENGNKQNFQFGGMLFNSLNMNPSKHLYIGLELGLGFTWVNRVNNVDQDTRQMAQFAFKLGYRF